MHYCLPPNGTFSGSFSDNHTRTCTQRCPSTPDYYSDNSTGRCVFYCSKSFGSNLTFADAYTRRCVDVCPANQSTFGDPLTLRCVARCPQNQSTFADPVSQRCVLTCPASPPLYADNFTQACISGTCYHIECVYTTAVSLTPTRGDAWRSVPATPTPTATTPPTRVCSSVRKHPTSTLTRSLRTVFLSATLVSTLRTRHGVVCRSVRPI